MKKKLSIIIPVYNAEAFLPRCIESILNQTYRNLEILLVNDGSKDDSLQICLQYAKTDNRILVFDKSNGGAASARNLGLKHVTGEYIGFCDSDDFFDEDTFSSLINIMEENNLPTIECLSKTYNDNLEFVKSDDDSRELEYWTAEDAIRQIFLRKGNVSLSTRVTKAEYIKDLCIPEGRRVEDFYFTICLLTRTGGTTVYKYPFYNFVSSEGSVTRSGGGSIYLDAIYFYDKACEYLKDYSYDLKNAQIYYLLKIYYLLSISLTRKEMFRYRAEIKQYKKYLKKSKQEIKGSSELSKKEKIVLGIASHSFMCTRSLYLIKNIFA